MNKKNTDDSNNKRLESLKRQAEEFKQKKLQIRNDLLNKVKIQTKKIYSNIKLSFIFYFIWAKRMVNQLLLKTIKSHLTTRAVAKKTLVSTYLSASNSIYL
jgi:hypothetical protein